MTMKNATGLKSIVVLGSAYLAMIGLIILATGNPAVFTF